jgi:hypothetical protein
LSDREPRRAGAACAQPVPSAPGGDPLIRRWGRLDVPVRAMQNRPRNRH